MASFILQLLLNLCFAAAPKADHTILKTFLSRPPCPVQGTAVIQALGFLSLQDLSRLGVLIRVGDIPDFAHTRLPLGDVTQRLFNPDSARPSSGKESMVIVLRPSVLKADLRALAALLAHELAHVRDFRQAAAPNEVSAASERRGWLVQTHVTMELQEAGMPPYKGSSDPEEARLLFSLWLRVNIWQGKPIPRNQYGEKNAQKVADFNRENKKDLGLPALLRFGDMLTEVGYAMGPWDAARRNLTPLEAGLDAETLAADRTFRAQGPDLSSSADSRIRFPVRPALEAPPEYVVPVGPPSLDVPIEPVSPPAEPLAPVSPPQPAQQDPQEPSPASSHGPEDGASPRDEVDLDPARRSLNKARNVRLP